MEFQHIREVVRRLKYFNKHTALAASQCKSLEEHPDQLHSDVGSTKDQSIRGCVMLHATARCRLSLRCCPNLGDDACIGPMSARQRERYGQKNCKTPSLSVVVHVC